MLTENQVKEQLCIAYINAVAAICNYGCEITRNDMDSVDVTITCNGYLTTDSTIRSPEIKLQLKATENLNLNQSDEYTFPLSLKNYDDLRANTMTPRLLVVLNLPNDRCAWLNHGIDELILRKCAFWLNLKGMPESNNTTNVTVYLPSANIFSPVALKDLMIKASKEEFV